MKSFFITVTVYVLLSLKDKATYVGMALNAITRLKEHNSGKNRYTKAHLPWQIIYTESHPSWIEARVREKYLKSTAGKNWLKKYLDSNNGTIFLYLKDTFPKSFTLKILPFQEFLH